MLDFGISSDLVAVMDLSMHIPDEETVFIGLFMVDQAYQRKGLAVRL